MKDIDDVTVNGLTQVEVMHILFKLMECRCETCKSISHKISTGLKEVGKSQKKRYAR